MRYLLDTNVVSELITRRPDERVVRWVGGLDPGGTYLSVITVGEISKGVEKLPDSRRRDTINEWLTGDLLLKFEGRILTIDVAVMLAWGALAAEAESRGRTMPAMDSLISALALHHDLVLATRDEDDFRHTGVRILNPWNQG